MKMFSNCSGECCVCAHNWCCIAGHGDDDFSPASKERIIENLDKDFYPSYTNYMIKYLADKYNYIYNIKEKENETNKCG